MSNPWGLVPEGTGNFMAINLRGWMGFVLGDGVKGMPYLRKILDGCNIGKLVRCCDLEVPLIERGILLCW